jgi:hypothetical protein
LWLEFAGRSARATFQISPASTHSHSQSSGFLTNPYSDRILADVFHGFSQTFVSSKYVIEGFILPDPASPAAELIDAAGRCAFDCSQDLGKGEGPTICISERGE